MAPRKKTLDELRREAIDELERRGYDVRGKTPAQIRELLNGGPKSQNQMMLGRGRGADGVLVNAYRV